MEEACVTKALEVNHGCQVKCTGLYADVWYSEEDNKLPDKIDDGNAMLLNMLKDGKGRVHNKYKVFYLKPPWSEFAKHVLKVLE